VPDNGQEVMTVRDVAAFLRLHEQTVYKMAKDGTLPAYKISNRWRFVRLDVEQWLSHRRSNGLGYVNVSPPKGDV